MRVRDHIAVSTAGSLVLRPLLGRDAARLWAGSVLIDADHYVWHCLRKRRVNPVAAMRFFNEADAPQHRATRVLHSPVAPLAVLVLGTRRRALLPVAAGMALHIALDLLDQGRMERARAAALERDDHTCQMCGTRAWLVGTHLRRQPWLLPSYEPENLISLCALCHADAHAAAA
jgi:hypothetical protein